MVRHKFLAGIARNHHIHHALRKVPRRNYLPIPAVGSIEKVTKMDTGVTVTPTEYRQRDFLAVLLWYMRALRGVPVEL